MTELDVNFSEINPEAENPFIKGAIRLCDVRAGKQLVTYTEKDGCAVFTYDWLASGWYTERGYFDYDRPEYLVKIFGPARIKSPTGPEIFVYADVLVHGQHQRALLSKRGICPQEDGTWKEKTASFLFDDRGMSSLFTYLESIGKLERILDEGEHIRAYRDSFPEAWKIHFPPPPERRKSFWRLLCRS